MVDNVDLIDRFNGNVPDSREDLESLAGVGRKTANVVLNVWYKMPAIAVDTHVSRVSKRLGIAKENDRVYQVEKKLEKNIPKEKRARAHHQLVLFGRYICKARGPECNQCAFYVDCTRKDKKKRN